MTVNGIIAEYNPFHSGHKYQLEQSLALTGADYTVVVMSGNFVQRGAPAILDKHTRARMALLEGADLVLELPTVCATASAEHFAAGAVSLLTGLHTVTHLCFGSECGDITAFRQPAAILSKEPDDYRLALQGRLKEGLSYPAARTRALLQCHPELDSAKELLSSPNNILALEYMKALLRLKSPLIPVTVKRLGSSYHDRASDAPLCSALALRQALSVSDTADSFQGFADAQPFHGEASRKLSQKKRRLIAEQLPPYAADILCAHLQKYPPVCSNDLSSILYYKLLSTKSSGYEKYLDVTPDLSVRISNRLKDYRSFDAFCEQLKTKELTYTRISRCLLHITLDITKEDFPFGFRQTAAPPSEFPSYARVLGFRKSAAPLLTAIRERSDIPLITSLSDAQRTLPATALRLLEKDIVSSQLYHGLLALKGGRVPQNEYSIPLCIV